MRYALTPEMREKARLTMSHAGLEEGAFRGRWYSLEIMDPSDALAVCRSDFDYPLFAPNEYAKHAEGMQFIQVARQRLSILAEQDWGRDTDVQWGATYASYNDLAVFSGLILLSFLGEKTFELDPGAAGFADFETMVFVTSAFILDIAHDTNEESEPWISVTADGRVLSNSFSRYVHGDFRFTQQDITERLSTSPFDDITPVRLAKNYYISGYHSVEGMFLATLLRYAHELNHRIDSLMEYEQFLSALLERGARLGNFADAGCRSFFIEAGFINVPLETDPLGSARLHVIPTEFNGSLSAFLEGRELVYKPCGVRFTPNDVEPLFKGLHVACASGWYRTSLGNLRDIIAEMKPDLVSLGLLETAE